MATTATPGLTTQKSPERIKRFTGTERALHWIHAVSFFLMLGTGLVLYIHALEVAIGRRNLVKNIHLGVAVVWVVSILAVTALGNRKALAETWRHAQTIGPDDRRFLTGRKAPQGRLNGGQKVNTIIQVAFALLFLISGFFLWLGQRDHTFLFDGTGAVHDVLTFISIALIVGHLYLALIHPSTRPALKGMTSGEVDLEWAANHHSKWVEAELSAEAEVERISS
jgi:formate dehydrogenase subunit gamma